MLFAGPWSRLRYGFFDLLCFGAALAGAFATPVSLERYFPLLIEIGDVPAEAAGALIGCLVYDLVEFGV